MKYEYYYSHSDAGDEENEIEFMKLWNCLK